MADQPFVPYVSAEKSIPEFTIKAVVIGVVLGVIMTAANTYLGLKAGMTVSASIPAAVISMGILRGILRRGTILENNIVQTIASAGESLAAGIIFTVPALVITGVWDKFYFWPVTIIAILGGMLGVLFMIPLRRALIVEEIELKYPEGVACAEVLEVGETGGSGVWLVFSAMVVGGVFQFLVKGLHLFKETVEGAVRAGRSAFYVGSDVSPALIAVGYIVGFNVALLIFIGGALGWLFGIPIYYLFTGFPAGSESVLDTMWDTWDRYIRFMGVGAMVVGGVWSIIGVRRGIVKGIQGAVAGYRAASDGEVTKRTEKDLSIRSIGAMLVPTIIAVFVLYEFLTGSHGITLVAGLAMIVSAFFFVAVSSYIVGLVGSSNNPVSGMTISTVLFTSVLLLLFGMTGESGIIASLGVAGVVCCAACTAGDVSQDLKTGYLVGATPWKQQIAQVIGVLAPAFVIAPILTVLHASEGIGVGLKAPQATLFASITTAMFTPEKSLPWAMVIVGAAVGVGIIVMDEILKKRGSEFRTHVMPVAVGIYLPWSLGVPILIGGFVAWLTAHRVGVSQAKEAVHRGVLFGSGLIAGESLMGILLAFFVFFELNIPKLTMPSLVQTLLSIIALAALVATLYFLAVGRKRKTA